MISRTDMGLETYARVVDSAILAKNACHGVRQILIHKDVFTYSCKKLSDESSTSCLMGPLTLESDGRPCIDGCGLRLGGSVGEVELVAAELRVGDASDGAIRIMIGRFADVLPVL